MAKWADYCIYEVRYNAAHTHIDQVRAYEDDGGTSFNSSVTFDRAKVVSLLGNGTSFMTITRGSDGKWQKGANVRTTPPINGQIYIRTDADRTARDNLGNLPEF